MSTSFCLCARSNLGACHGTDAVAFLFLFLFSQPIAERTTDTRQTLRQKQRQAPSICAHDVRACVRSETHTIVYEVSASMSMHGIRSAAEATTHYTNHDTRTNSTLDYGVVCCCVE